MELMKDTGKVLEPRRWRDTGVGEREPLGLRILLSQSLLRASRALFGERPSEVWLLKDDQGFGSWEMVRNHLLLRASQADESAEMWGLGWCQAGSQGLPMASTLPPQPPPAGPPFPASFPGRILESLLQLRQWLLRGRLGWGWDGAPASWERWRPCEEHKPDTHKLGAGSHAWNAATVSPGAPEGLLVK